MFSSKNRTVKLLGLFVALSLIVLWGYGDKRAWGDEKKITVKLVWEKEITGIEGEFDFLESAKNYFKVAESRILNPSAVSGKRIVALNDKLIFLDGQDKITKQIILRKDENLNPETGEGIMQKAVISEDAQNAGVITWGELQNSFAFYNVGGVELWELDAEVGSTFSNAYISNKDQKIILVSEPAESSGNPYTIVFLNVEGEILKEYTKESFIISDYRNIVYNSGYIDIPWTQGDKKILTRLDLMGNFVFEKDVTNFLTGAEFSVSGKYYGAQKREGDEYYFYYIYDMEDKLIKKLQVEQGAGFSKKGDYLQIYYETGEQIIDLNTGLPFLSYSSISIPGEEPNNVERLFTDVSRKGDLILYSLVRKGKGKPSWVVLLDKDKKKLWQETFSQCANESEFSEDENFIRVYLKKCNLLRLYRIEGK